MIRVILTLLGFASLGVAFWSAMNVMNAYYVVPTEFGNFNVFKNWEMVRVLSPLLIIPLLISFSLLFFAFPVIYAFIGDISYNDYNRTIKELEKALFEIKQEKRTLEEKISWLAVIEDKYMQSKTEVTELNKAVVDANNNAKKSLAVEWKKLDAQRQQLIELQNRLNIENQEIKRQLGRLQNDREKAEILVTELELKKQNLQAENKRRRLQAQKNKTRQTV